MKKSIFFVAFIATAMVLNAQVTSFGIGVNTPNAVLHVHQTQYEIPPNAPDPNPSGPRDGMPLDYRNSILMTNPNTGTASQNGFRLEQYNNDVSVMQQANGFLEFSTPGGRIILSSTGRFGHGDTVATHRFNVQGTARFGSAVTMTQGLSVGGSLAVNGALTVGAGFSCDAQGYLKVKHLKVTLTDWPDYVFADGYALMPLGELEAYIDAHSHLPGLPSADEVEQEGADLGEMNRLLMEKVEELTLYIIDLQKQIDKLKSNR